MLCAIPIYLYLLLSQEEEVLAMTKEQSTVSKLAKELREATATIEGLKGKSNGYA